MHSTIPILHLKTGREKSLLRRHPWIFSGAVKEITGTPLSGETLKIVDQKGTFLAYAMYSPESQICARIWTFNENEKPGRELIAKRMKSAFELRKSIFGGQLPDAYRLINAESDFLPGLIADIYGSYAVCQISSTGMENYCNDIAELLLSYAQNGVYERSDIDSRRKEGLQERIGTIIGDDPPERIVFKENGIIFSCNPREGHKTGFYLDQRMNRKAVSEASNGIEDVLNCFSYTGGFGLAALKGGAKRVLNVDVSQVALKEAERNAETNGFSPGSFQTLEADAFHYLRACRDSRKTFDMIILDPPKFAGNLSQKEKAARGYKDINLLAIKLLRPGGKLFTFSCSGAMDEDLFSKVVASAASDAGKDFRITHYLSQGPDHVVSTAFPEGRYLKGIAGVAL